MLVITMTGEGHPTPRRAELYVRSLQPDSYCQQQRSILNRIAGLVADGVVTEREVHVAGCQVPASVSAAETAPGRMIALRLARFQDWAARNDCTLGPAIQRRDVEDRLAGTNYSAVRVPAILLAEFCGDDLLCVTPHCVDGDVTTVRDRVAQLEAGDPTEFEPLTDALATNTALEVEYEYAVPEEHGDELLRTT